MFRSRYWSCTKFGDIIRGTKKIKSGTSDEWATWTRAAKRAHPIRFWIVEEGFGKMQDFINWPMDQVNGAIRYFNNRFIARTHYCVTGLKPGEWHETDERLLHGNFNELVRFVNNDKAWMEYISHAKIYNHILPWHKTIWPFYDFTEFNRPALGLEYLRWEMSLIKDDDWFGIGGDWATPEEVSEVRSNPEYGMSTPQAVVAREIMDLYIWWTEERKRRLDPHDAGGWSAYCDHMRSKLGEDDDITAMFGSDKTDEERVMSRTALDATHKIEESYESEDTEMLIRLIKIRKSMWT